MLKSVLAIIASLLIEESGDVDGRGVFAIASAKFTTPSGLPAFIEVSCTAIPRQDGRFNVRSQLKMAREGTGGWAKRSRGEWSFSVEDAVASMAAKADISSQEFVAALTVLLRSELALRWKELQAEREAAASDPSVIDWDAYAASLTAEYVAPMDGQLAFLALV